MQLLRITNKPDSAYEICSKFSPDCQGLSASSSYASASNGELTGKNFRSETLSSSSNKKNKTKAKNNKKSKTVSMVKLNDAAHDSLELDSLNLELNGEDDYYDALNSGNEDEIYTTHRPSYNIDSYTRSYIETEFSPTERYVN